MVKGRKTGRTTSSKSIIFVSDMHVMSNHAVCPRNAFDHTPNPLQEKLIEGWEWCLDQRKQKTHLLFLNGEPIDGQNRKSLGVSNYTTDWKTGLGDSQKLLVQYKPTYFMMNSGSDYHVDENGTSAEEILAEMMKARPYRAFSDPVDEGMTEFKDGKHVDRFAFLDINNILFNITHHIGFNRWFAYKTTALAREMAEMTLASDKWLPTEYLNNKAVLVRSHVHYFVGVHYPTSTGFTTPAWKYPDGFLLRSGMGGTMPHIGTVEVIVEPNEEILVHPHIMPTKMLKKVNVVKL